MIAASSNTTPKNDSNLLVAPQASSVIGRKEAPVSTTGPNDEDEEVRIAMEMALAAAQNPGLSPDELRNMVGGKNNKQSQIVNKVQLEKRKKEQEQRRELREKRVNGMRSWVRGRAAAAAERVENLKDQRERARYAEAIAKDKKINNLRKRKRFKKKALKAHRLQGHRTETRHVFQRQRLERNLIEVEQQIQRKQKEMLAVDYNVHTYAKAMMRASRKWKKHSSTDQELALEAELCRNMHQMLALQKQKAKQKKCLKETKKYLECSKSWLAEKKSFSEMNILTLREAQDSMKVLYEETVTRQDALIQKLLEASDEYKDVDLTKVAYKPRKPRQLLVSAHPYGGLMDAPSAIYGLHDEQRDRTPKQHSQQDCPDATSPSRPSNDDITPSAADDMEALSSPGGGRKELVIETKNNGVGDGCSIHSQLSDDAEDLENSDSDFNFGNDAPWMEKTDLNDDDEKELSSEKNIATEGKEKTNDLHNEESDEAEGSSSLSGEINIPTSDENITETSLSSSAVVSDCEAEEEENGEVVKSSEE